MTVNEVWFYKANIVDYVRLALLLAAFAVARRFPLGFMVLYAMSQLMDMLDGHIARRYNQTSKFGAVLDMVLDRASNSMFFVLLGTLYPSYAVVFGSLALLDLCSHWTIMYSSLLMGVHHKKCRNPLLVFYYKPVVLALLCAGNEGCWLGLYALAMGDSAFPYAGAVAKVALAVCAPLSALKQVISVVQWQEACSILAEHDLAEKKKKN